MVLPRGSESWRRMSRFRRQSLVKPLAAEVLEPRCLMTEATGMLAAADAAPLTGAVVVDASLWDDAGLTLQQVGDLLHVFRTDTQNDVIRPLLASQTLDVFIISFDLESDMSGYAVFPFVEARTALEPARLSGRSIGLWFQSVIFHDSGETGSLVIACWEKYLVDEWMTGYFDYFQPMANESSTSDE